MFRGTHLFAIALLLAGFSFVATADPTCTLANSQETCTFGFTGSQQTFTVPAGVTKVTIQASGGQGGDAEGSAGGKGGSVTAAISVTPGETLYVYVGSQGHNGIGVVVPPGGLNSGGGADGGAGGTTIGPISRRGGGGGASSDVRQNGTALSNRVVVAGGSLATLRMRARAALAVA